MILSARLCSVIGKKKFIHAISVACKDAQGRTLVISKNHVNETFFSKSCKVLIAYKMGEDKKIRVVKSDGCIIVIANNKIKVMCLDEQDQFNCQSGLKYDNWDRFVEEKHKDWRKKNSFENNPDLLHSLS